MTLFLDGWLDAGHAPTYDVECEEHTSGLLYDFWISICAFGI